MTKLKWSMESPFNGEPRTAGGNTVHVEPRMALELPQHRGTFIGSRSQLLHELGIATEFEGPGPMRIVPMDLPDPVHGFRAHANHESRGAGRPVRSRQGKVVVVRATMAGSWQARGGACGPHPNVYRLPGLHRQLVDCMPACRWFPSPHRKNQADKAGADEEQRGGLGSAYPATTTDGSNWKECWGAGAPTYWTRQTAAEAVAAHPPGTRAAAAADGIRIHGHCTSIRQGSPATNCCAGVQGDARECENISLEGSGGVKGRGTADIPEHPGA